MDAYGTARLAAKDAESAIVARICEDFNLTPVLARAHYEQMARYFSEFGHMALQPGELCYLAVASDEPAGKPIIACRKVQVALELASGEDREVLRDKGLAAMRGQRLARLARQAQVQGGLLTVEDLAYLTCSSTATVKRDLAACRDGGVAVPTRGQIRDIGPGISHKAQVVQLYLWGLQFTEIERRTCHSEDSIRRYLADFRQIAALYARGGVDPGDPGGDGTFGGGDRRVHRDLRAGATRVPGCTSVAGVVGLGSPTEKGGPTVSTPVIHSQNLGRRLARRTLPSLLRYKFLHEYGYDKGAVVVAAIVEDICTVVRKYYRRPDDLEPGQLIYLCPAADERQRKGKTMAHTRLVPVRLTVVAQADIDAMVAGVGALERRELRVRRLAHEAYEQGGVLSEADLSLVTGYTDGGVSATVIRLRERGEMLPIRGYVADMGSWPTHKAAIIRLYLEGLTTPEIASRTYHAKKSVDRYIEGFERVRLLDAKHPREELPLLTGLAPRVVAQYLAILDEHQLGRPVHRRRRVRSHA